MYRIIFFFLILSFVDLPASAQHLLGRIVSVKVNNMALADVLNVLSQEGNCQFSYKSDIMLQEKKVSLNEQNKTVKYILDKLLEGNYHYTEKGKYIIIRTGGERFFTISGYIQNGHTGERLSNVSVYEEQILVSTLTNEKGYFRLPIKNKKRLKTLSIVVRKEDYSEHVVSVYAGYDQELILPIVPSKEVYLKEVQVSQKQTHWVEQFFLSSKQKVQNLNIGNFIAKRPIQSSLLPGLGTHGIIGAQVVNKFSLNVLGGYTAGVNGVEIGSLFNINKGDVRFFQIAGIFNAVNGTIKGMQVAGIYNYVSGNTIGFQASGIDNYTIGKVYGWQVAGVSNLLKDTLKGVQTTGVVNYNEKATNGVQVAGVVNVNKGEAKGLQIAGINNHSDTTVQGIQVAGVSNHARVAIKGVQVSGVYNYARNIKGFQFGLVNIADSMQGVGLGLVNYYKNGLHKLVLSADELLPFQISFLSGKPALYSVLGLATNVNVHDKAFAAHYGLGTYIPIVSKLKLNSECKMQLFYLGTWSYVPIVYKMQVHLTYTITPKVEIFGGTNWATTEDRKPQSVSGYSTWLARQGIQYRQIHNNDLAIWMGWQVGMRFF